MASIDWRFASSLSIRAIMRLEKTPTGTGKDWPIDWEIDRWVRDTLDVYWNHNLIFRSFTHLTVSLTAYGNGSMKFVIIYTISYMIYGWTENLFWKNILS